MLGRLSRWLRLLGFDTLYSRTISDNELISIARQQDRIVLTRDTGISKRKGPQRTILLHSNDTFGQLKELLNNAGITRFAGTLRPRCAVCNSMLDPVEGEAVADSIPEYVLLNATSFLACAGCGKVYWHGSHTKSIDSQLRGILAEQLPSNHRG